MNEVEHLSKKQRRQLRKQEKREGRELVEKRKGMGKVLLIIAVLGLVGFGLYRWVSSATEDLTGEEWADLGAEHTQDISGAEYNSNPPTSGTHFPVWATKGIYDRVLSDGHLIHSLEHGYVVVSYNCEDLPLSNNRFSIVGKALAHGEEDDIPEGEFHPDEDAEEATGSAEPLTRMRVGVDGSMSDFSPANPPEAEVDLPESFSSSECEVLKTELGGFFEKNKSKRTIVVPRPDLDASVALTAWTRLLKMDTWDEAMAQRFLNQWNNKGPEQTVE